MKRNEETPKPKAKLTLEEIFRGDLSFKQVVGHYFPRTPDSRLNEILWSNTDFPYTKDEQKIVDQIYSFYLKSFEGSVKSTNRNISVISF